MNEENYRVELAKKNFTKHGLRKTRIYNIWCCMKKRCYNSNYTFYKNYGGRGIRVCDEWKENVQAFNEWSIQNGYDETLTLDRIDNDKSYSPANCRWATRKVQNNNSRNCHLITFNDKTQSLQAWSEEVSIPMKTIWSRLNSNWSVDKALTTPLQPRRKAI